MGEVYRARDARLGRDIALKILPRDVSSTSEALRRFEQEARAASALNHPNIVTIYETGHEVDTAWIAMELIDGDDLRVFCEREPLPLKNALRVALKIVEGLAAAHDRGIVHRDLKPDNIMITRDGFVKILDFGLAKQVRAIAADDTTIPQTSPGSVFGTVGYMAPEQAAGRSMDYRSDQFSFGVMLYEMLTRQRPFERSSKAETMAAIIREGVEAPSTFVAGIPPELDRIVLRCLEKNPADRYASTRDLAHDLREVRDTLAYSSNASHRRTLPARVQPLRSRWIAGTLAAAGLILVIAAAVVWRRHQTSLRTSQITSVAVLPFRNAAGSTEGRLLADAIAEMIASRLASGRDLRVIAPFIGAPVAEGETAQLVAKRRGVDAVVQGSVERDANEVRVAWSVVDGVTGDVIAASKAHGPASDVFALEDNVSADLLSALGRASLPPVQTASEPLGPDAQRKYIQALALLRHVPDAASVDRAVESLQNLLRESRDSAPVNALLARGLYFKSQLTRRPALIEQATLYAKRAVTLDGTNADALVTLGLLQTASGQYQEAVKSYERALALRREMPDALTGLADAWNRLGKQSTADALYRRAIGAQPDNTGALMNYGVFCYSNGRYDDAAKQFRAVTVLTPRFAHAWANLGAALQAEGRNEEAAAAFRKSLELEPTPSAWSNLGTVQYFSGHFAEARDAYQHAVELAPTDHVMWGNLGDACRMLHLDRDANAAYTHAVDAARAALAINTNDVAVRSALALALMRTGRAVEAQSEIQRALELDPLNASALYKASLIATARDNDDAALSWLARAVAAGYPAAYVTHDPDLAPLRGLPGYSAAMQGKS